MPDRNDPASPLASMSDAQLIGEIERRRREARDKAEPAFRCPRCGATASFYGSFSASRFEQQARKFAEAHESCVHPGRMVISALFPEVPNA